MASAPLAGPGPAADVPGALVRADRADLGLEYADTRFWRGTDQPTETMNAPADLLAWCKSMGALDAASADALAGQWQGTPEAAGSQFAAALDLRETIFRVFQATAGGQAPATDDLAQFNRALDRAPPRARLERTDHGFAWRIAQPRGVSEILAAVLWTAGDLLVSPRLARVRQCANPLCKWLFLDDSKSGTRRWCSMSACGNRAKAHRHYLKKKQA